MTIQTTTLPHTETVDGLGVVHIYRNSAGRIAVDINGTVAWTFMVGLREALWQLNSKIEGWKYLNKFRV